MKREFKVLMHDGKFVADWLLCKGEGIHEARVPSLWGMFTTMEQLIKDAEIQHPAGGNLYPKQYAEDLKKCTLEVFELTSLI